MSRGPEMDGGHAGGEADHEAGARTNIPVDYDVVWWSQGAQTRYQELDLAAWLMEHGNMGHRPATG
jgi:hypothetical protein